MDTFSTVLERNGGPNVRRRCSFPLPRLVKRRREETRTVQQPAMIWRLHLEEREDDELRRPGGETCHRLFVLLIPHY